MDFHAVFSEYLRLKKKGSRFFAVCPFHKEKDPSLSVDVETGLWHCFGCKEGGNVFQFIAKIEHLEMSEVVEMLAKRYGVDLRQYQPEKERQRITRRQFLLKIVRAADGFYRKTLVSTTHGQQALKYLQGRGLSEGIIKRFGIGVTPLDASGLTHFLQEHNARTRDLIDLNLTLEGRRGEMIDMLRSRIIFPLFDHRGEVVSFAGRALGDGEPKYLNTQNTPLYNKSRMLYGFNFARKAITEQDAVFIVEGYMDVISLYQAGVVNTVATCGTSLTSEHIKTLARNTDNFLLAFDGDAAGITAALRSSEEFMAAGHYPRAILLPEGKDPDDVARAGGKKAFDKLKAKAVPYPRLIAAVRIKSADPEPMEVKRLFGEVAPVFSRIRDAMVQEAFSRDMAGALRMEERQARDLLHAGARVRRRKGTADVSEARLTTPREDFLSRFFAAVLADEKLRADALTELTEEDFPEGRFRELFTRVVKNEEDYALPDFPKELAALCAELKQRDAPQGEYSIEAYVAKIRAFKLEDLSDEIRALQKELAKAQSEGDDGLSRELGEKMQGLLAQRAKLAGELKTATTKDTEDKGSQVF